MVKSLTELKRKSRANKDPTDNPPVLHQKDLLVQSDYPLYEKFAKLSRQEEDWGLLDNWKAISDRLFLAEMFGRALCRVEGHRLVWRKDADPYQVKLVRSAIRAKQAGVSH